MDRFENKGIRGVHVSRYIASWSRMGGKLSRKDGIDEFRKWLNSLGLSEDEVDYIAYLADNGRLELETSAQNFLTKIK